MEFNYNVNEIFKAPLVEINHSLIPPGYTGDRRALRDVVTKVSDIVNALGEASASAQGLTKPITTADRLRNSEHKLYLLVDSNGNNGRGVVTGMLKTGNKSLYVFDRDGVHYQVAPPCLLDFYIHETRQRNGLGKQLFEHMLQKESIEPVQMAIDRPSDKLLGFFNKHYRLNDPVKQMNNYVVYDGFFPSREPVHQDPSLDQAKTVANFKKNSANGLQSFQTPLGRYGAPRPPCSMGQIIHNQSPSIDQRQESPGPQSNSFEIQSTPNMYVNSPIQQNSIGNPSQTNWQQNWQQQHPNYNFMTNNQNFVEPPQIQTSNYQNVNYQNQSIPQNYNPASNVSHQPSNLNTSNPIYAAGQTAQTGGYQQSGNVKNFAAGDYRNLQGMHNMNASKLSATNSKVSNGMDLPQPKPEPKPKQAQLGQVQGGAPYAGQQGFIHSYHQDARMPQQIPYQAISPSHSQMSQSAGHLPTSHGLPPNVQTSSNLNIQQHYVAGSPYFDRNQVMAHGQSQPASLNQTPAASIRNFTESQVTVASVEKPTRSVHAHEKVTPVNTNENLSSQMQRTSGTIDSVQHIPSQTQQRTEYNRINSEGHQQGAESGDMRHQYSRQRQLAESGVHAQHVHYNTPQGVDSGETRQHAHSHSPQQGIDHPKYRVHSQATHQSTEAEDSKQQTPSRAQPMRSPKMAGQALQNVKPVSSKTDILPNTPPTNYSTTSGFSNFQNLNQQNFQPNLNQQNFQPNLDQQNFQPISNQPNLDQQNFQPNLNQQNFQPNLNQQNFQPNLDQQNFQSNLNQLNFQPSLDQQNFQNQSNLTKLNSQNPPLDLLVQNYTANQLTPSQQDFGYHLNPVGQHYAANPQNYRNPTSFMQQDSQNTSTPVQQNAVHQQNFQQSINNNLPDRNVHSSPNPISNNFQTTTAVANPIHSVPSQIINPIQSVPSQIINPTEGNAPFLSNAMQQNVQPVMEPTSQVGYQNQQNTPFQAVNNVQSLQNLPIHNQHSHVQPQFQPQSSASRQHLQNQLNEQTSSPSDIQFQHHLQPEPVPSRPNVQLSPVQSGQFQMQQIGQSFQNQPAVYYQHQQMPPQNVMQQEHTRFENMNRGDQPLIANIVAEEQTKHGQVEQPYRVNQAGDYSPQLQQPNEMMQENVKQKRRVASAAEIYRTDRNKHSLSGNAKRHYNNMLAQSTECDLSYGYPPQIHESRIFNVPLPTLIQRS